MKKKSIILIILLTFILSVLCIGLGSIEISPSIVLKIIVNSILENHYIVDWKKTLEVIILQIRIPRVILGFIAGASMSIVGVLMQNLTKNNLAEPYILGISSGASAGAVAVIILSASYPILFKLTVEQGAFIGSLLSILIVFCLNFGKTSFNSIKLVLIGIGVSSFFSALTTFIIYSSKNNSQIITAMFWMTGSLSSSTKDILLMPFMISISFLIVAMFFSHELDIFLLGESAARSLGINTMLIKVIIILFSTLLISVVVSVTGIIGFVGLIIPHISRKIVGYKHVNLLPFSYFFGGLFLVVADTVARTVFSPEEVPIGVITAFCGVPIFLWMIKSDHVFGGKNDKS